jgi:ribokinase
MTRLLNFGSINIDLVFKVPHIVRPGETISSRDLSITAGGKGANQSAALAKAGVPVFHAGLVGSDGEWIKELLEAYGVETTFIRSWDGKTGQAIIQVAEGGENSIVLYGGGNAMISDDFIAEVLGGFGEEDCLLLQNEISNIGSIMEQASARGMKIFFNPAPCDERVTSYPLHLVHTFFLNETEALALSGASPGKEKDPQKLLDTLVSSYPESEFILTLGEKGACYGAFGTRLSTNAYPVKAVDTTAAGDTFIGYYLAAYLEGKTAAEALVIACRAAAITVTAYGAMETIPCKEDLPIP